MVKTPSDVGLEYTWAHDVVGSVCSGAFPVMRSCPEWDGDEGSQRHRFRFRVFYTADDISAFEDQPQMFMTSQENGTVSELLAASATPAWNHDFDDAVVLNPHPTHYTHLTPAQYRESVVLPYSWCGIGVDQNHLNFEAVDYHVKFWGAELSVEHHTAYSGHDVELTDFSDPPAFDDHSTAPSWLASRLLIDSYNRILYDSTWMIQRAIFAEDPHQ